jgi:uncharacterized membrane protein
MRVRLPRLRLPRLSLPSLPDSPSLTRGARALGFLVGEGASLGLGLWVIRASDRMAAYVRANTLTPLGRKFVMMNMAGGAALFAVFGLVLWMWRRAAGLDIVDRVARRCAPLCLFALVPMLFHWRLWYPQPQPELSYLVIVSAFGLCLQGLMRVALESPPVFPDHLTARATAGVRQLIDRARQVPWLPTATVALGALAYAVYFSIITLQNHYRLGTSGYDLGIENNLVWNAAHFNGPLFKSSVLGGPTSTHQGLHSTWISYLIAIPYRLLPRPETLLVLQAMLIGGAALPLYAFARRHLRAWLACLVSLLFLLYPPLQGSNLYDFHYLPFAPFFLWTTLALLESGRDRWAVLSVVLTLANREDMSALLVVMGVYMVLAGRRPRAGMIVAAVGAVYFVAVKMIWMPRLLGGDQAYSDQYQDLIPHGEHGFGGVLKTVFANPGFTIASLIERDKLSYLLQIMAPLAFFPWRRPIGALCTVPGFLFTLLSTRYPALIKIGFQYTAYWTSFLFIAVVENLAWLKRGAERAVSPAVAARQRVSLRAWVVALTVATIATSYQLGVVFQRNTAWGGFLKFEPGGITPEHKRRHADLYALIAQIPPDASVAANELVVAHVSSRKNAYTLKIAYNDADYLLVRLPLQGDERTPVISALRSGAYGVAAQQGDFTLFRRGLPPTTVAPFLRLIGG